MEIDHIVVPVLNYESAKRFYVRALEPFGFEVLLDWHDRRRAYLGVPPGPSSIWLVESRRAGGLDVTLSVKSTQAVDAFHRAALSAGARNVFEPGLREEHAGDYYAARVVDLDANAIEVVHRSAVAARAAA
jgi:catechol 2,3-dioxygenase-like lactoylglutathione lyase family enzyme